MSPVVDSAPTSELRAFARRLGYQDDLIAESFPVWLPEGIQRPSIVGFASAPKDMTTATLVAEIVPIGDTAKNAVFQAAEALAAPAVVTFDAEGVQVWWLGEGKAAPARIASIKAGYQNADRFAGTTVGRSLSPDALLKAKRGAIQPSLFPVSVSWIQKSRGRTENRLEDLVTGALSSTSSQLRSIGDNIDERDLTQLVLSAFTLSFIRDRFGMAEDSPAWAFHIRDVHPHLNRWMNNLGKPRRSALQTLMAELSFSVNLSSLDPALMSNVYERTMVTEEERSELGVVYTPSELAQQLLWRMPVEEIAPEQRRVLDPTCGSGTLLLAAHDRLRDLVSSKVSSQERHRWITGHLTGWDRDPFAVEVARLCLTLNAFPEGNGWKIDQIDALAETAARPYGTPSNRPTIIVSNPPWKASRSDGGVRNDLASVFFKRALNLLSPEGILGIVMPGGWLSSRYSATTRRDLRESCEVLEVWRLPERTFRNAEAAPAIIIAKKTERVRRLFHLERRVINRANLDRFYFQGVADSTTLVQTTAPPAERPQREAAFMARPLTGRVANAKWPVYISDVARLRSGPTRHKGAGSGRGDFLRADRLSSSPYFSRISPDACSRVRWPEDFDPKSGGNPSDYAAEKLLVTGKIRADSPWSSRVRVDLLGIIPTDAYIMVIPDPDVLPTGVTARRALNALAALLGSVFASAWVDERRTTRNISPDLFRNLPLPSGWETLSDLGQELVDNFDDHSRMIALTAELDRKVFDLYGLSSIEVEAFRSRYAGSVAPEKVVRFDLLDELAPVAPSENAVTTYGAVLDLTQTDLTLWAPGVTGDEGINVSPPPRFPGSLLWRGADFKVRADPGAIASGEFSLHSSAWKSPLLAAAAPSEYDNADDDGLGFDDGVLEDVDG